jgi:hypothetical protein
MTDPCEEIMYCDESYDSIDIEEELKELNDKEKPTTT